MLTLCRRASERGFTLPEAMLAIGIGSVLLLGAMQFLPILKQHTQQLAQRYQLDQLLRQTAMTLQKDFRRAGFCSGQCNGKAIVLSAASGEGENSCITLAYDLNRNGSWEPAGHGESEYFSYRLRSGMLENQRGRTECNGSGWERMLDPGEIEFTRLAFSIISGGAGKALLALDMQANWKRSPLVQRQLYSVVKVQ